jgi:sialidase-1
MVTRRKWLTAVLAGCSALALAGAGVIPDGGGPATAYAAPAGDITYSTVFERGEGGYHTFRIPAIVKAADGSLLAFAEGRLDDPSDDGDIDLVLKRSSDGGATWGPLKVVADDGPNKWGNPVPILDRNTGRVVVNTTRTAGHVTGGDVQCGRVTQEETRRSFIQFSDDHGVTWSEPVDITGDVRPDNWRHFVGGPGHGIQLAEGANAGRLVIPGNHSVAPADPDQECAGGAQSGGHSLYSDDGGKTWHLGAVDRPGDGVVNPNESAVVELGDGTLYFSTRNQGGSAPPRRAATTSSDGGTTFDAPYAAVEGITTSQVQGSLLRLPGAPAARERVVFSAPGHASSREKLTLWSSFDDAATWSPSLTVYDGPAGYSDLVHLDERALGVIFENGERLYDETELPYHHRITFARVPVQALDRPAAPPRITPDSSGHGYHGLVGGSPQRVDGVFGAGREFAGDYIELPMADELSFGDGPFTAAAWFKTTDQRLQTVFWAHAFGSGQPKWWIRVEPGANRVRALVDTGTASRFIGAPGDFADGEWHHVALTRDADGLVLYVDGAAAARNQPVPGSVSAGAPVGIRAGARVDGINNPMVGALDELWLFDRALDAEEIAGLAAANTATDPLVHLRLDQIRR